MGPFPHLSSGPPEQILPVLTGRWFLCPWDEGFLRVWLGNAVRRKVNALYLLLFAKDQQTGKNKSPVAPLLPHDKNLLVVPVKTGETTMGQCWLLRGEASLS